jgi:hypothetical protein
MSAGEKLSNRISSDMYKTNQCYFPEALITKWDVNILLVTWYMRSIVRQIIQTECR